ncbi:MAG: type II secretion system minor pseudopilin GspH [Thiolinea sp.]
MQRQAGGARGFSLLELLIVMVVMGLMISIAALSLRSFEADPAEKALERLRFNVELLINEAVVRSEPLAFGFAEHSYAFYRLDDEGNKWVMIDDDLRLKPQPLDNSLTLTLLLGNEEPVSLPAEPDEEPQVFVYPTGEVTPFTLELQPQDRDRPLEKLEFDALGQVVKHDAES